MTEWPRRRASIVAFLNRVALQKLVQLVDLTPSTIKVVVVDGPAGRVDDDGVVPAWKLDQKAGRLAAEELGSANDRFLQVQATTGG